MINTETIQSKANGMESALRHVAKEGNAPGINSRWGSTSHADPTPRPPLVDQWFWMDWRCSDIKRKSSDFFLTAS